HRAGAVRARDGMVHVDRRVREGRADVVVTVGAAVNVPNHVAIRTPFGDGDGDAHRVTVLGEHRAALERIALERHAGRRAIAAASAATCASAARRASRTAARIPAGSCVAAAARVATAARVPAGTTRAAGATGTTAATRATAAARSASA